MTREELRRRVVESRAAQGLPPTIQDPATLARLAVLLAPAAAQERRRPAS